MDINPISIGLGALATGIVGKALEPDAPKPPAPSVPAAFTGQTGLGTVGYDPYKQQFTSELAEQFKAPQQQALGATGAFLGQLGTFDPQAVTQRQYEAMEALQAPARQQAQLDLEDRLYAQGRLGSTGGALQQQALQESIQQQQAQNQLAAYQQGLMGQRQLADLATGMFGLGMQPQQMLQNQLQTTAAYAPRIEGGLINAMAQQQEFDKAMAEREGIQNLASQFGSLEEMAAALQPYMRGGTNQAGGFMTGGDGGIGFGDTMMDFSGWHGSGADWAGKFGIDTSDFAENTGEWGGGYDGFGDDSPDSDRGGMF